MTGLRKNADHNELAFNLLKQGGMDVQREYRFHPVRRWRFDFAIPKGKVALELEGGLWIRGHHVDPVGYIKEMEKYSEAAYEGWFVFRADSSNEKMIRDICSKAVARAAWNAKGV